jgi:hypothetical protein
MVGCASRLTFAAHIRLRRVHSVPVFSFGFVLVLYLNSYVVYFVLLYVLLLPSSSRVESPTCRGPPTPPKIQQRRGPPLHGVRSAVTEPPLSSTMQQRPCTDGSEFLGAGLRAQVLPTDLRPGLVPASAPSSVNSE